MNEIKDQIETMIHIHGSGHGFKDKALNEDIMRLIELVEEKQARKCFEGWMDMPEYIDDLDDEKTDRAKEYILNANS